MAIPSNSYLTEEVIRMLASAAEAAFAPPIRDQIPEDRTPEPRELVAGEDFDAEIGIENKGATFEVICRGVLNRTALLEVPEWQRRALAAKINGSGPLSEKIRAVADLFQQLEMKRNERRTRQAAEAVRNELIANGPQNPSQGQLWDNVRLGRRYRWSAISRSWEDAGPIPSPQTTITVETLLNARDALAANFPGRVIERAPVRSAPASAAVEPEAEKQVDVIRPKRELDL